MSVMPREWDGGAYHRLSEPQYAWGLAVLDRLALAGDESVLDAGCGSGRLTARLAERVPAGGVLGLDRSIRMLAEAARHAPRAGAAPRWIQGDLLALPFGAAFDVVFSTATFHWVLDHDRLFAELARVLRPGGRLHAQCGGAGNLERAKAHAARRMLEARWRDRFLAFPAPWLYAPPADTERRLAAAGFRGIEVGLESAPTRFADAATLGDFLRAVVLRPFLARLPEEDLRRAFLEAIVADLAADDPPLTLDYVRLNLAARLPE